jgi:polyphenol oxidase
MTRGEIRLLCPEGSADPVWFTDRRGGVSSPPFDSLNLAARVGDDPSSVAANRARVAAAAGFELAALRLAKQVHGADLIEVGRESAPVAGEADVLLTREPGVTIGILTADCTPVVVVGSESVSIAHAGWRGLAAGAVQAAVEAVGEPRAAYVGPSIRACCYEVGSEVIEAFEERGLPIAGTDRVDPGAAAVAALRGAGVEEIAASDGCTSCDPRYFSYRRDGVTGRQGAFVTLPAP